MNKNQRKWLIISIIIIVLALGLGLGLGLGLKKKDTRSNFSETYKENKLNAEPSYKIIIARYNENLDWLNLNSNMMKDNYIIINKGNEINYKNKINRKNNGRESDSYLYYIINNYNNLPDYCIFTQGDISDHIGNNGLQYLFKMLKEAKENGKSNYRSVGGGSGGDWGYDFNIKAKKDYFKNKQNYKDNKIILFRDWFEKYIKNPFPKNIFIYSYGLFAVSKELILKHDINYYRKLINQVNYINNPVEGHFFERSWYYIFE